MRPQRDLLVEVHIRAAMPLLARKPRPRQRLLQRSNLRNRNLLAVQRRSLASLPGKHLIPQRVVDHASHYLAIRIGSQPRRTSLQAQNHAERRKPMRKVRRPIQRIDIPAILALEASSRPLLAVHSMRRKRRLQLLHNQLLARTISLGHKIDITLVLGRHALGIEPSQQRSRLSRNAVRNMRKLKSAHNSLSSTLYMQSLPSLRHKVLPCSITI